MHVVGVGIPETGKDSPPTLPLLGVKSTDAVTLPAVLHGWEEVRGVSAHPMPDTPRATAGVVALVDGKVRDKTKQGEVKVQFRYTLMHLVDTLVLGFEYSTQCIVKDDCMGQKDPHERCLTYGPWAKRNSDLRMAPTCRCILCPQVIVNGWNHCCRTMREHGNFNTQDQISVPFEDMFGFMVGLILLGSFGTNIPPLVKNSSVHTFQ